MASVTTDKRTGNTVVRVYVTRDYRPSVTVPAGAAQDEIDAATEALELKAGIAGRIGRRLTIGGLVAYYLDTRALYGMSPNTIASYESNARCYVYPHIGSLPYADAAPLDFSLLYQKLLKGGGQEGRPLAQVTVKKLSAMLSGCFSTLVKDGVVADDPTAGVCVPRGKSPEAKPLTDAAHRALRDWLREERGPWRAMALDTALWLALRTGVRAGELAGFFVSDFRRDARTIRVARAMKSGNVYGPPKSETSKRILSLDQETAERVAYHIDMQEDVLAALGVRQTGETPLFAKARGTPMPYSAYGAHMRQTADAIGLGKDVHLHTLRHTHATQLLEGGVNIRTVQERLGHSEIAVTLGIYGHVMPGRDAAAADAFAKVSDGL